jgi:hypothetical protein
MMHFRRINTILGWMVFALSALVYLKTIEASASFWDCGEFISCAYKLEVGHQPGAPFFMLLGRAATLFAGNNTALVAKTVNSMSALASAFTIMFLFWTITMLAGKISLKTKFSPAIHSIIIFGSGIIGALACTFSDTFWFSAVEGEVYATSSLFTAIVFWAILKWEASADDANSNPDRWIILIAYLMGLSIGVHLLNLLTIPALVLVYYFKKYSFSLKGLMLSLLFSFVLLGFVVFGFIPGVVKLAAITDLLFVNGFGLPVNSGAFFYLLVLALAIIALIKYTHKYNKVVLNKIALAFTVMLIGYSSYILLCIRADANPPLNLNKVNNPFSLLGYINREQYVSRPLFYGPYYNAPVTGYHEKHTWVPDKGRYKKTAVNGTYLYAKKYMTLFPRMSSTDAKDIEAYKKWGEIGGGIPSFSDNLYFFFRYQLGYMYWRYFMWNFSGRQTEIQGTGSILSGNWISGIRFLDELRLGPQDNIPQTLKSNKGRNTYYLLPLLLGIAGLLYHYNRHRKNFAVVMVFFLMTGIAIVVYLNEIPVTPRERDYAVGGSFYVFCIWIGLGVMAIVDFLGKITSKNTGLALTCAACMLVVPSIMATQNFDDHNRSKRSVARDFAYDYLNSCAPNAILFTNADNDTYPLWYAQEVEGIRTDVRIVLVPFLNADFYLRQLADWHYNAAPVPTTIGASKYSSGKLDYIPYYHQLDQYAPIKEVMEFLKTDDPRAMVQARNGEFMNYFPTNLFRIPADSINIDFTLPQKALMKYQIAVLDIIATNNWRRPVYFLSAQVPAEFGLQDYLQLEGFAYRLVPIAHVPHNYDDLGSIQADDLYDKLMNRFKWGNMNNSEVFMDDNSIKTISKILNMRSCFARVAEEFIKRNDKDKAIRLLDRSMELMPAEVVPYNMDMLGIILAYYHAGAKDKAILYCSEFKNSLQQELAYFNSQSRRNVRELDYEIRYDTYLLENLRKFNF